MYTSVETLKSLLEGEPLSGKDLQAMDAALKKIFYGNGFMRWAKKHYMPDIEKKLDEEAESIYLEHLGKNKDDILVESFASLFSNEYQAAQQTLFYHLPNYFLHYEDQNLEPEYKALSQALKAGLSSKKHLPKLRAHQIIARFAETSNAQMRRTLAGEAGEKTIEFLLKSIGWKRGKQYGKDFMYQNSVTDFTVPYVRDWHAYDVMAYIVIQASTNDRAKLTSSSLHPGAKRYLCSLNGCGAASKGTSDISDAVARSFRESETFYVVIEAERQRAIKDAIARVQRYRGTKKVVNAKRRLEWLNNYTINYSQFVNELRELQDLN